MLVEDAESIVSGGDNSTAFFPGQNEGTAERKIPLIVTTVICRIGLATQCNALADQVQKIGSVKLKFDLARVETHVTAKSSFRLRLMIGEVETKIRSDPVGNGRDILKKVFRAVRRREVARGGPARWIRLTPVALTK